MTPLEYKEKLLKGEIRSSGHFVPAAEAKPREVFHSLKTEKNHYIWCKLITCPKKGMLTAAYNKMAGVLDCAKDNFYL